MLIIGHRGASRAAPENTPPAFALADRMGADGVELDVHLAPDGALLVHHDALPDDPSVRSALPTLSEVLDACGDRMLVNVEIKDPGDDSGGDPVSGVVGATIAELLRRGGAAAERWLLSSFSWEAIEQCRANAPSIPTAFLVVEPTAEEVERTAAAGHRALHPWEGAVTAETVERCHRAGLAVNVWTCNDPERLSELAALGVDGVCTDVPDVALEALGRAGAGPVVNPRWGTRG